MAVLALYFYIYVSLQGEVYVIQYKGKIFELPCGDLCEDVNPETPPPSPPTAGERIFDPHPLLCVPSVVCCDVRERLEIVPRQGRLAPPIHSNPVCWVRSWATF